MIAGKPTTIPWLFAHLRQPTACLFTFALASMLADRRTADQRSTRINLYPYSLIVRTGDSSSGFRTWNNAHCSFLLMCFHPNKQKTGLWGQSLCLFSLIKNKKLTGLLVSKIEKPIVSFEYEHI
jgi:hypothetical protein